MRNVTIRLTDDAAQWVQMRAAERDQSVSAWLAELVEGARRREESYSAAMERYLARTAAPLKQRGEGYPAREDLHHRAGLR